jgi:hypothetical protein
MVSRLFAAIVCGIGLGLALGFGIAFAAAEKSVVDGFPHDVVRYEVGRPECSEGTFPAGLVPHRVVKENWNTQLVESQAAELGWRLGVLYAICGVIVAVALVCGAQPLRVFAAGVIPLLLIWLISVSILNSRAERLPALAMDFLVALGFASCEALRSATFKKRKGRPADWEC